ncbi:hypothetical protein PFISCL1PPCAC_4601, partial [Pristionchus fissidentatus]
TPYSSMALILLLALTTVVSWLVLCKKRKVEEAPKPPIRRRNYTICACGANNYRGQSHVCVKPWRGGVRKRRKTKSSSEAESATPIKQDAAADKAM